jgi:hypothetical protein
MVSITPEKTVLEPTVRGLKSIGGKSASELGGVSNISEIYPPAVGVGVGSPGKYPNANCNRPAKEIVLALVDPVVDSPSTGDRVSCHAVIESPVGSTVNQPLIVEIPSTGEARVADKS